MMAWGICTVILSVLLQLYVNTLCLFSKSPLQECLAYYRKHAKEVPYIENLLLKLFFRGWVCVASFVMEIFSAFAFDDGHFLHHSFLWRYIEDFVVAIGLITSRDIPLTITLLSLNFGFVILKDGGFIDDVIFSIMNRAWIYSVNAKPNPDLANLFSRIIEELKNQTVRSKLNYSSRIIAIVIIGMTALLDNYYTHGARIWSTGPITASTITAIVVVQLLIARQINIRILQAELKNLIVNDDTVVLAWKRYLTLVTIAGTFISIIDFQNIPI
ncbi:hypothetical protein BKA69DRAFT_1075922 [Paraphysoderma sedebokerense]|nr:hypothetical protein BKA69DRAFT_1075922 [Paraphysoderma sedebokerense]